MITWSTRQEQHSIRRRVRSVARSPLSIGPGWSRSTRPPRTARSPRCCVVRVCTSPRFVGGQPPAKHWLAGPRRRGGHIGRLVGRMTPPGSAQRTSDWPASWPSRRRWWRSWETARALGERLREHGHDDVVDEAMSTAFDELRAAAVPTTRACVLAVSYTHLRAHETDSYLVCRL